MSKLHKLVATTAIVSTIGFGLAQVADADTYTVKKGDTLWDIAINNGTTVDQLMQDNNLTSSLIFPGDKLTYSNTVQRVAQAKAEGYYTVALGDTLGKVASKFGTSVDKLVKLNNISNPHLIYVGEVIKINETAETKAEETKYPVTITTYNGDGTEITQTFEQAPEHVITNNLSATKILIDLGLQDKIVGMLDPDNKVTDSYAEAIEKIPHIGDKKTVSQEVALSYNPDAIIGRNMMFSDKSLGTVDTWNQNGINIYSQKASVSNTEQSLNNVIEDIINIGIIFNVQEKANAYAKQLQERVDAVLSANKNQPKELKNALIMCAYNDETYGAYKSALQESILNVFGYTNVATGTSGLTLENLVTSAPEFILYVTSDRNQKLDTNAVELMKNNAVLADVPAIKNGKILTISYDELMDYGPSVIDALESINTFLKK